METEAPLFTSPRREDLDDDEVRIHISPISGFEIEDKKGSGTQDVAPDSGFRRNRSMRDIFHMKTMHTLQDDENHDEAVKPPQKVGLLATFKYANKRGVSCAFSVGAGLAMLNGVVGSTHVIVLAELIKSLDPHLAD